MSISLSAFSSVVIDFVGEVFIPVLDKNNANFSICLQKWQQFRQTVMKRILNYKTEQQLRQKASMIYKKQKQQKLQKHSETKSIDRYSQSKISQDQKSNNSKTQQYSNKNIEWPKQEVISFRDRKISIDENQARKQKREQSQIIMRKQERSNSFNANGFDSDMIVQVPLIVVPGSHTNQKPKNAYQKKENDILSFNSISDFHKSRNNIPVTVKQVKDNEINLPQQQLNLMSKKSIDDTFISSISQARPNSYSTNYIQSIKKINIESRSPTSNQKPYYSDLDTSQDYVENTPMRNKQHQNLKTSNLQSIKKRISDVTDYLTSPQIGSTDSFSKFLSSFKKVCTTFQSNHQKLLREDFNNKYINC